MYPPAYIQNIGTLRFIGLATIEELRQTLPGFPQSTHNLRSLKLCLPSGKSWDQSVDPFESLTPKLRCLQLLGIPLYPSILQLRSLAELDYRHIVFDLPLDTLLDFLEENQSLKSVALGIALGDDSLRNSQGRTPARNQLQCLPIFSLHAIDTQALVSGIALQRGACLDITSTAGALNAILSGLSSQHLLNLHSLTLMRYRTYRRKILLIGPNREFSLQSAHILCEGDPFVEFPLLSLSLIQRFHLVHCMPKDEHHTLNPVVFDQSSFPALQILAVDCQTSVSHLLSKLFSNPSSPPSLKTLAFLNCDLDEESMEKLARYALDRKGTTSAWLHQVVIINADGIFPSVASIRKLEEHVPVVDVRVGVELLRDLI
ncbi:hypothetical protein BJ322DRAFT_1109332 [Thelephora terrestris]|uniref:Uncharacterized protein n=1 Tax=Thelephora terrestris TaxID=56493 RepID=A0A9P6HD44_9AGAM|nr:hypothetical protein BJ322DRAFT_1109332 [Thelephora terrestris]